MGKKIFYEVDYITKAKTEDGKKFFRVKWVGWPSSQNTWQPEQHLPANLIKTYYEQQAARQCKRLKGKSNKPGQFEPDRSDLKILEKVQQNKKSSEFTVSIGKKTETVTRDYLFETYPTKLANYYLQQYLKQLNI